MPHSITANSSDPVSNLPRPASAAIAICSTQSATSTYTPPISHNLQNLSPNQTEAANAMILIGSHSHKRKRANSIQSPLFREYNRKEKSLGLLCEKFLQLYKHSSQQEISLDAAASKLHVERRRIYDIVNILESIRLVSRKSKNVYLWHGFRSLSSYIAELRERAHENTYSRGLDVSDIALPPTDSHVTPRKRGKSLLRLSQMFVRLFLQNEDRILPLDEAARRLILAGKVQEPSERLLKTKIRRLYDIANVLASVGLIEKLQISPSKKPVFRWRDVTEEQFVMEREMEESCFDSQDACQTSQEAMDEPVKSFCEGVRAHAQEYNDEERSVLYFDAMGAPQRPEVVFKQEEERFQAFMERYRREYMHFHANSNHSA